MKKYIHFHSINDPTKHILYNTIPILSQEFNISFDFDLYSGSFSLSFSNFSSFQNSSSSSKHSEIFLNFTHENDSNNQLMLLLSSSKNPSPNTNPLCNLSSNDHKLLLQIKDSKCSIYYVTTNNTFSKCENELIIPDFSQIFFSFHVDSTPQETKFDIKSFEIYADKINDTPNLSKEKSIQKNNYSSHIPILDSILNDIKKHNSTLTGEDTNTHNQLRQLLKQLYMHIKALLSSDDYQSFIQKMIIMNLQRQEETMEKRKQAIQIVLDTMANMSKSVKDEMLWLRITELHEMKIIKEEAFKSLTEQIQNQDKSKNLNSYIGLSKHSSLEYLPHYLFLICIVETIIYLIFLFKNRCYIRRSKKYS